jgi:hypothetical protein
MDAFRGGAQELTDDGILGQNPVMEGSESFYRHLYKEGKGIYPGS